MTPQLALFADVRKSAVFSECGKHRYRLERHHGDGRLVCFIMLNPSRAGVEKDDPTVRKCLGFARRLGYRGLVVVNLFSMVATDPTELLASDYAWASGDPDNFEQVVVAAKSADLVIAAWGCEAHRVGRRQKHPRRDKVVAEALASLDVQLHALKVTKSGHPQHPLYLAYDCKPKPWSCPA